MTLPPMPEPAGGLSLMALFGPKLTPLELSICEKLDMLAAAAVDVDERVTALETLAQALAADVERLEK